MSATDGYAVPETVISIEPDEEVTGSSTPKGKGTTTAPGGRPHSQALAGSIGSPAAPTANPNTSERGREGVSGGSGQGGRGARGMRQTVGGIKTETRYTGIDTLDEPVTETILRDLRAIYAKVIQVLRPSKQNSVLRDWDLWGPLIFCLTLAVSLSLNAPAKQSLSIFTGVFVIVWIGSLVVTLNAKLLGGAVSFFQSLCVLGYCLFPLDVAAVIALFVHLIWVRIPLCLGAFGWAIYAAVNFLGGTRLEEDRAVLAVFPLFLFYFILAWMVLVSP